MKSGHCPVATTLSVVGGKWKTIILYHLEEDVRRFAELKRLLPGISQKVLTQQLRELERSGIVLRHVYAQVPPKVEYSLTEYGQTLRPVLRALCDWGTEHERRSVRPGKGCVTFEWNTSRTLVMGILNVTPDSFFDGGRGDHVARAQAMAKAGADIIDIGGESTRPGSQPVSVEELGRALPVIKALPDLLVSIDTTKAEVARQAVAAGARIINDISASLFEVARETGAGLVLMHMRGTPATMQQAPRYDDVLREVREFLAERIASAEAQGVKKTQIAVDPGIGFGKSVEHNLQLLARLEQLRELGCPILVGASRKSFLGRQSADRLSGSLAAAIWAVTHGARIVRAHDVAETVAAVRLIETLEKWNT